MTDKKLTSNFKLSEFTKSDPTDYQLSLLKILANELQIVRNRLQEFKEGMKPVYVVITSGVRTKADYDRLVKKGYNPSKTSDHFCGYQTDGNPTLGAADINVYNCSMTTKQIALYIKQLVLSYDVNFGQVIYEKNPATGAEWIHLGNDPELIFKNSITVKRKKFLMSLDNGKTYKELK
jgi:hypothetical protein